MARRHRASALTLIAATVAALTAGCGGAGRDVACQAALRKVITRALVNDPGAPPLRRPAACRGVSQQAYDDFVNKIASRFRQ